MARVLIVDDDDLIVDLVRFTLESRGYEVLTATDGEEALDLAGSEPPDLVILDGMMPGLDGLQVLRRLSEGDGKPAAPVIMLSARRQQQDVVGGLASGAEDYVVKPFMPEELAVRVTKLLTSRAA